MFEFYADLDESALVAAISRFETLKARAAAAQARAAVLLATKRRAAEEARGVPAAKRGRGLGAEIALARRDSPSRGGRHLGFAQALVHEMPNTLAALESGVLTEWRATLIVRESACLDVDDRRALDAELCADASALVGKGDARIAADAKAIAYRLDPRAVVDRAARAETERTVTVRPAPDCMSYVTALLPVAQGVSVYAALKHAADTNTDARTRGQVMADALVARVTGREQGAAAPVAVNLVLTDDSLFGGGDDPGRIGGFGPIPAGVARALIAAADAHGAATLRRLYAHPVSGALVAMESRARLFPRGLARFISTRDDTCRTPYCDAPIRHIDHIQPAARGGMTSVDNGDGLCEACNYTKEAPGWRFTAQHDENGVHTTEFTTPTGARHRSQAPPLPGQSRIDISRTEWLLSTHLGKNAA